MLHVLAGVLIIGTAISEIWLNLDSAGRWLFGIYGAAAAIALLGIFAFYLAFVAELPPPPPKPLKPKAAKKSRRGRRKATEDAATPSARKPRLRRSDDEATVGDDETSETEAPAESEEPAIRRAGRGDGASNAEDDDDREPKPRPTPETDDTGAANGSESAERRSAQPARRSARSRCVSAGGHAAASPSTISPASTGEPAHCHDVMRIRPQPKVSIWPAYPVSPADRAGRRVDTGGADPPGDRFCGASGHGDRGRGTRRGRRSTPRSTISTPSVRAPVSCSTPTARC